MNDFWYELDKYNNTDFESKIHVNCGFCGLRNGCKIRKAFIETAKQFTNRGAILKFDLKCPFEEPKYKEGETVKFTVAYGAHKVKTEWECDWDDDYCNSCTNKDNCREGIVTFRNKRYLGKVELTGKIKGYMNRGKYIIDVPLGEFLKVKYLFNRYDLMVLHKISDSFGWVGKDFIPYFVTKQRYMKPVN